MRSALLAAAVAMLGCVNALAAPVAPVWEAVKAERGPFLESVRQFVEVESGSSDQDGLARLASVAANRLRALGAQVEVIEPGPMVQATFRGRGTKNVLFLAHMDTVYEKGMLARQPFRIDGDRAYGLGISDEKQGLASILHALAALKAMGFDDYGRLTVLLNSDEEIGSPASRELITRLGSEHDLTLSFEAATDGAEEVSLVTSGLATAVLKVHGESAHPANFERLGVNALVELAHQLEQMRDLPDHPRGLRFNWTVAHAGTVTNRIPDEAEARGDIRVVEVGQIDALESKMRERIKTQRLPGARVELTIERGRPPLQATAANRAVAEHAKAIASEIGRPLRINDRTPRGGTDAAYAGLRSTGAVLEHFGVAGANAHSSRDEYIVLSSIEPRLYLTVRTVIDACTGNVRW